MANNSLKLTSLDFDTLKQDFKDYLSTQSVFRDYNFEGSNINVLLDVMSLNTFKNSYYLNMVFSEMFLDSAQKYDSAVSHSIELNYVPRSYSSAQAELNLVFETTGTGGAITIPKGSKFTGTNSNGTFSFVTSETNTYTSSNNTFNVVGLDVYEGFYLNDTYIMDYTDEAQQFLLNNPKSDISSISVSVVENGVTTYFKRATNLFGLDSLSNVFFVQPAQGKLYEIVFGNGITGRKPINGATVTIDYRICNGVDANSVDNIVLDEDLNNTNTGNITLTSLAVTSVATGGSDIEDIASIKFNGPRYYATQERGVAPDDYYSLILSRFSGSVGDISVYGGETVEPKKYGVVIVSVKPTVGEVATNTIKNQIISFMEDYNSIPISVEIQDPDYLYCSVASTVQYDKTLTSKTKLEIESAGIKAISDFSTSNLEKFGNDLRLSQLSKAIDNSDPGVSSNETSLRIIKRIAPLINYPTSYQIKTDNEISHETFSGDTTIAHTELFIDSFENHIAHASFYSSIFTYNGENTSYPLCYLAEDGKGNIKVYNLVNGKIYPLGITGSIDYINGSFQLNNLSVSNYSSYISLYLNPKSTDIYATKNKIVKIAPSDITLTAIEMKN